MGGLLDNKTRTSHDQRFPNNTGEQVKNFAGRKEFDGNSTKFDNSSQHQMSAGSAGIAPRRWEQEHFILVPRTAFKACLNCSRDTSDFGWLLGRPVG